MDYDAFFKAVRKGNDVKVKEFIDAGIDVNIQDEKGDTALHVAVETDKLEILKMLLKAKGINVNIKNGNEDAPIHVSIRHSNLLALQELLKDERVDVNLLNNEDTPLILAITFRQLENVKEILKRPDLNVEKKNKIGNTPLRYAVNGGNLDIVNALLKKGVYVDALSKDNMTALHEAININNFKIVDLLLRSGASTESRITAENITPLIAACTTKNELIITRLLIAGAEPNDETTSGLTPLYICCNHGLFHSVKDLIEWGANPNIAVRRGPSIGNTPLYVACKNWYFDIVETLLEIPDGPQAIDKKSEASQKILKMAKEGKFIREIQTMILKFFKASGSEAGNEPWKGWTRSDAEAMDAIFGAIEPHKNFPENERYAFVPLDDITYCPICLAYTPRLGKAGETKGCMYMYHDCTKTAGVVYHEGLYDKYKSDDGLVWWCTICNRIAKGHQHYALGPPDVEGSVPRVLKATGSPFDKSCKPGHGGGGVEEKIRRFMRLREVAKELSADKMTRQEAVNTLVEEMWTAGLTERRNAKRVAQALEAKGFPNKAENFPANRPNNAAAAANRNYPNITRSAANLAELKPEISKETPKWDSIELDTLAPAALFKHRKPDGTIVRHDKGRGEDGEDGEWLSFKTIKERVEYYVKNFSAEGFGMCPIGCGARLYPDEVKDIVSDDLYQAYRKAFNKYPWPKEGGRRKRQTRKMSKKQRGGAYQGIFHSLTDGMCVKPWKVNNTKRANR